MFTECLLHAGVFKLLGLETMVSLYTQQGSVSKLGGAWPGPQNCFIWTQQGLNFFVIYMAFRWVKYCPPTTTTSPFIGVCVLSGLRGRAGSQPLVKSPQPFKQGKQRALVFGTMPHRGYHATVKTTVVGMPGWLS